MDILQLRESIRETASKRLNKILDQEKRSQALAAFAIKATETLGQKCKTELEFCLADGSYGLVLYLDWLEHKHHWHKKALRKILGEHCEKQGLILITTHFYCGWLIMENLPVPTEVAPQKVHILFKNIPNFDLHAA